ncbi:helix-turn-helix domain-containing protein [Bacillus sp. B15-48]|uniref:PucR family transcriptional regulator n=1 Tax=Bacillus sp. B15-48 TaxID=1548601 RepID=UPI00193F2FAC|nr:helix-turn-helix domain-containing protein [Bacillus sp. B15-48]
MSPLTYETLITYSPFFHMDILGGWNGKRNKCQHVQLDKMPIKENSFILIYHSDDTVARLEKYLKDKHSTGILILSEHFCDLPSFITKMANECKKPLFLLKYDSEIDVYKRIKDIFYLHELHLLSLIKNDLTTYWLELFYRQGIESVIERFNLFLGQEVFLFTNKKTLIHPFSNKFSIKDIRKMNWVDSDLGGEKASFSIVQYEKEEYFAFEVVDPDKQSTGYLVFEKTCTAKELNDDLFKTIEPTMITWAKQIEVARKVDLKYHDQFLFDVLHNNIDTESELFELGLLREMEFTPNSFVLSMNLNSHQKIVKDSIMNIQHIMVESHLGTGKIYTTYLNHRIVAIVCPPIQNTEVAKTEINEWISRVRNQIQQQYPSIKTVIGIGRSYYSNLYLYKSFQESKIALEMEMYGLGSNDVIHYDDIGFVRLLSYIHNDLLRDFAQQYLGRLEEHDSEQGTELVHTLSIYCTQNGDITRSAEALFIHQNTLRQRLKKIESILNIKLDQYSDLVNLILSIKISHNMNI